MNHSRLNGYKVMWIFVFFDLPTNTSLQRKTAAGFRKKLLKDGFKMLQYSVYARHCVSSEALLVHKKRVESLIPKEGHISVLTVTDKQYGNIYNIWGFKETPLIAPARQLEMF